LWKINGLGNTVHAYAQKADIGKQGACHMFRHTCATVMLEGGADIRYIQQLLGHEELSTTQTYTRVYDKKLKEVHTASHPSARFEHRVINQEDEE
jgi:integrase/recombinase XerD